MTVAELIDALRQLPPDVSIQLQDEWHKDIAIDFPGYDGAPFRLYSIDAWKREKTGARVHYTLAKNFMERVKHGLSSTWFIYGSENWGES